MSDWLMGVLSVRGEDSSWADCKACTKGVEPLGLPTKNRVLLSAF